LAGPAEYTYKEIVEFVSDVTTVKRPLIDVPLPIAEAAADVLGEFWNPFLTRDMLARVTEDTVLREDSGNLTFSDLNIEPVSMDKMAFEYLHRFRPGGHFRFVTGYHGEKELKNA
jgi:NADH dehydrogenase (ubiquinone) 1 alpha subcomplex subunit 9